MVERRKGVLKGYVLGRRGAGMGGEGGREGLGGTGSLAGELGAPPLPVWAGAWQGAVHLPAERTLYSYCLLPKNIWDFVARRD